MKLGETVGAGLDYLADHPLLQKSLAVLCIGGAVGMGTSEVVSRFDAADQAVADLQGQLSKQQAQMDRLTEIAQGATGLSREGVMGANLRKPEELAAYGNEVGDMDAAALKQAAVKLYKQALGSSLWIESCSGTLLNENTENYILTARHCVTGDFQGGKGGPGAESVNITTIDPYRYGVVLGGDAVDNDTFVPEAAVTQISISMTADMALMAFDDPGNALDASERALPTAKYVEAVYKPGESALSFSIPSAAGGKMVRGDGVYLGTVPSPDSANLVDVVGLTNADTPSTDACNFGASGSSVMLANGHITGPLSERSNLAYAEGAPENAPDISTKQTQINSRLQLEQKLGVDTVGFNTLCQYTTLSALSIPILIDGFSNPVPASFGSQSNK